MKTISTFLYIFYMLLQSILIAGENEPINDARQVINQFTESRKNLNSFIIKSQEKSIYTFPEFKGTGTGYRKHEYRFDGNRCKNIEHVWGDIDVRNRNVKEGKADYYSTLWDGETAFTFSNSSIRGRPTAVISKKSDQGEYFKTCSDSYKNTTIGEIMGYHWGDQVRIDELFINSSTTLKLQEKKSNVRGVDCYVVEAVVPGRGKYTVWIDPIHDFHIARMQVQREAGDHIYGILLKQNCESKELFEVLEYEKVGDAWFPKTCKEKRTNNDNGYHSSQESEISFSTITLNPDHDALGSFLPDDIPNGAKVFLRAFPPSVEFFWEDGEIVSAVDQAVIDGIDSQLVSLQNKTHLLSEPNNPSGSINAKSDPDSNSDLKELLARLSKTQNALCSFVAAAETTVQGDTSKKEISEFRMDGNRIRCCLASVPVLSSSLDKKEYKSLLWDGTHYIEYMSSPSVSSKVLYYDKGADKKNLIFKSYTGAMLTGRCPEDTERVDIVLSKAKKISLRNEPETINKSVCRVIDATTTDGSYTLWVAPSLDYQIAKMQVNKTGTVSKQYLLSDVQFEKIEGLWIPMEGQIQQKEGGKATQWQHKRTKFQLNPDHQTMKSFVADDIPDGTEVWKSDSEGISYIWLHGEVVKK